MEEKEASEWFLEYVVQVLEWYVIRPADVSGTGPDCKKAFDVWAHRQHGWTWYIYIYIYISICICIYIYIHFID